MGFIERTVENLLKDISTSIRKFTAFIFLVFAIGVVAGEHAAIKGDPSLLQLAYSIPLVLALASYLFVEIAIAFFAIFLILLLFL
ncbi:MAG TPA: hypothetical protein VJI13_02750 [Candidatus Norongarragalinales archaeon]|nr:hypothetical protein [Candidatus Norongarragalinales archaeon]